MLTFMALQIHPVMDDPGSSLVESSIEIFARHAQHYLGHIFHTGKREVGLLE